MCPAKNLYDAFGIKDNSTNYKNYEKYKIKLPSHFFCSGASGRGKSNCVLSMIVELDCFDRIIIVVPSNEILYDEFIKRMKQVEKKRKTHIISTFKNADEINLEDFDKDKRTAIVFDDLLTSGSKNLKKINDFLIRSRKFGISCFVLSQSWKSRDLATIRKNSSYFLIKEAKPQDLERIGEELLGKKDVQKFINMYKECSGFLDCLFIDNVSLDERLRFRNYLDNLFIL